MERRTAMILIGAVVAVVVFFSHPAMAQTQQPARKRAAPEVSKPTPKPVVWDREPDSFMGLKFGQSITAQLPECPINQQLYDLLKKQGQPPSGGHRPMKPYDTSKIDREKLLCFQEASHDPDAEYRLPNPPDIGITIGSARLLRVPAGTFEGMRLIFRNDLYPKMRELLVARYGEPQERMMVSYSTLGGASVQGARLEWNGKNVTIRLYEYGESLQLSLVYVATEVVTRAIQDEKRENAERNKGKL